MSGRFSHALELRKTLLGLCIPQPSIASRRARRSDSSEIAAYSGLPDAAGAVEAFSAAVGRTLTRLILAQSAAKGTPPPRSRPRENDWGPLVYQLAKAKGAAGGTRAAAISPRPTHRSLLDAVHGLPRQLELTSHGRDGRDTGLLEPIDDHGLEQRGKPR